jgi:two-component system sensor kinase FixL
VHVLNIEDDRSQRQLVERGLSKAKFKVTSCSCIADAIDQLNGAQFCVAVVDLGLLDEDGLEFVRELVRRKLTTKVIIHTANANFQSAQVGIDLGVFAYVEKSAGLAHLVSQVERASSAYLVDSLSNANREIQFQVRLLDSLQEGAIATNSKFEVIFANRSAQKIFGITETEILGRNILQMLELEDAANATISVELQKRTYLTLRNEPFRSEIQVKRRNGSDDCSFSEFVRTFRLTVSLIGDMPEKFSGFILVLADISEQKQAEIELNKARQIANHSQRVATIGELASVLAHEINQPLGAISNYVGGLLLGISNSNLSSEEVNQILSRIQVQAIRASEILSRTRNYLSREIKIRDSVDINSLIVDSLKLLEFELLEHRVQLDLQLESGQLFVYGDRVQLSQVLVNVLKNAAEAMVSVEPEKRKCRITTRATNCSVTIEIQDNGPGVDADRLLDLLEPYQSTKVGGLGLGLSTCQSIMKDHDGCLKFKSQNRQGLTVQLQLPRFETLSTNAPST